MGFSPSSSSMYVFIFVESQKGINRLKGNTKFWYGVMNLVQMNILQAYAILQYSVIVVEVEIDSKFMKL